MERKKVQIFAVKNQREREEITDLYWFEENYIHNFEDFEHSPYDFEIFIDGVRVYPDSKEIPCQCSNCLNPVTHI
jgi:hypothetical protein